MKYNQLTLEQRYKIEALKDIETTQTQIAAIIGVVLLARNSNEIFVAAASMLLDMYLAGPMKKSGGSQLNVIFPNLSHSRGKRSN